MQILYSNKETVNDIVEAHCYVGKWQIDLMSIYVAESINQFIATDCRTL